MDPLEAASFYSMLFIWAVQVCFILNDSSATVMANFFKYRRNGSFLLTLSRLRLANWHEFAMLTQGNSLASVLPSAFWAQDGGFNHSDDMKGSGQTCTTHKHQQEVSEKSNNKQ